MNYETFQNEVLANIRNRGTDARLCHRLKNNNVQMTGVLIESGEISPIIYLEEFYKDFTDNRYQSLAEVADEILELYEESRTREICHVDIKKKIKDSFSKKDVVCKLVHTKMNEEFLKNVPHREWLDLSIVYMIKFDAKDSVSTITITNEILKSYALKEEELYEIALENIKREGYTFKTVVQSLKDLQGEFEICDMIENIEDDNHLYVLTNPGIKFGATAILSNEILEEIACRLKTDYYIIPSSIDEVLIMPMKDFADKANLDEMVREINQIALERNMILSEHVYLYSIENHIVTM